MNPPNKSKKRYKFWGGKPKRVVKEKSCGVILYRKNDETREFLLLHYPGGHWDFPKGHVEKQDRGERGTAYRELKEETGITEIEFISGYREPMYYEFNRGRKERVKKTVVYFLAETEMHEVEISHEHKDFIWLPYEKAMEKLTFDNARELMQKAEEHLISL
jgi:bis(5'-nucleosidyl)-tetraphosphatase